MLRLFTHKQALFVVSLLSFSALGLLLSPQASAFAGGDGTSGSPYLIANCVQLEELDDNTADMSSYFKLANDIDCSDTVNWNEGEGWVSLASFSDRFSGTLDGDGHSINNIYMHRSPTTRIGLFSYIQNATFKNLSITGSMSNSTTDMGACSGALASSSSNALTIDNVHSTLNLSGEQDSIGGLIGCVYAEDTGAITVTDSSVSATLNGGAVGGLIGDVDISNATSMTVENTTTSGSFAGSDVSGFFRTFHYRTWDNSTTGASLTITNSGSSADITVTGIGAGLVGNLWLDNRGAVITRAKYTGTMTATAGNGVGGLIWQTQGTNNSSTVDIGQSYVSSSITSTSNDVGGLVGKVGTGLGLTIEKSYFGGVIDTDGDRVGGLIGNATSASQINNSYADVQITADQYVGGLVGTGTVGISKSFAFGSITSPSTVLGGLAGSLEDSTVSDSFAAVSVPANQPTTISGLIGASGGMTVLDTYVDANITEQPCNFTGAVDNPDNTLECTPVNSNGSNNGYFFNNMSNPPLNQWDFDTVWEANQYFYPCLQWQTQCQTFQPQVVCEMPSATDSSIHGYCDIQARTGFEYGNTTWIARYKKVGDSNYQTVALDDSAVARTTVSGLQPQTAYYLEFQFTNNWGTGQWARLEITTSASADNDGILDSVEDAGPNNGDANGDGTPDKAQANVASYVNPVTTKYAVLVVDQASGCEVRSVGSSNESSTYTDSSFDYPLGLMDFSLHCNAPGATARITQYYYQSSLKNFSVRKFNPNTHIYAPIVGATVAATTISGNPAIKVDYSVSDGGSLDTDGSVNGTIVDPVGLAAAATTGNLGDTGSQMFSGKLLAGILFTSLLVLRGYYASTKNTKVKSGNK